MGASDSRRKKHGGWAAQQLKQKDDIYSIYKNST